MNQWRWMETRVEVSLFGTECSWHRTVLERVWFGLFLIQLQPHVSCRHPRIAVYCPRQVHVTLTLSRICTGLTWTELSHPPFATGQAQADSHWKGSFSPVLWCFRNDLTAFFAGFGICDDFSHGDSLQIFWGTPVELYSSTLPLFPCKITSFLQEKGLTWPKAGGKKKAQQDVLIHTLQPGESFSLWIHKYTGLATSL